MANQVLKSENENYGFYGTIAQRKNKQQTEKDWQEAFETLTEISNKKPEEIRTYLDSKSGRKLADACIDSKYCIKDTILMQYFNWIEDDLYGSKTKLENINSILFGTKVYDEINGDEVIALNQGNIKGREGDYIKVINQNEKIYILRMDCLRPIED